MTKTLDKIVARIPNRARRRTDDTFPVSFNSGTGKWYATGKRGKNRETQESTAEYERADSEGNMSGERLWMTEEEAKRGKGGHDRALRLDRALAAVPDRRRVRDAAMSLAEVQAILGASVGGREYQANAPMSVVRGENGKQYHVIRENGRVVKVEAADAARRRDKHHRALDAILARIPRHRARGRDAMTAGEKEHYVALKRRVEYLQRVSVGSSGEDRRKIEAEIRSLGEEMDRMRERTGDEERGIKIPMPKDPKERAAYEAAIAARRARGSGKFVGEDAVDRALALIPDHRRPARRAADRLRRGLGLDSILSKSDARAILREYHAGSKKRLQDLARELKLDERAALAWVLKEAESGKDARDASYLVTAKFADNSTFRQIYQDASEAEAKYADLAADPKVVDCDIQDYEGTPEFEVGDALTEAEMYKAGARMARTGSGKIQVVEKWIEENNLTPNLAAAVMRGFRAEQQSNSHSGRLGGGRTGDALDRVLAAIPNRKRKRVKDATPGEIDFFMTS